MQVEIEEFLLISAILLLAFDFFQISRYKNGLTKHRLERGLYATIVAVVLVVISYALFVNMFLYDDFSLIEAQSHSASSLSLLSKLHASWAGAGGSLLLLSLIIALVYFVFRFRTQENPTSHGIVANRLLIGILIFFLIMTTTKNPFARFDGVALEGVGLNPSLQSIWMTIHPPIVFVAYAFVLLATALALARISYKIENGDNLLQFSLKLAWFFLTLGIALGAFWAYNVIGWGGYWSWDPVETGSLMIWLALTAYFHVRPFVQTGKELTKKFMVLLIFESLVFLSALTRGGFRQSVHSYALSPAGPILILFGFTIAAYFFYLKQKSGLPLWSVKFDKFSLYSVFLFVSFVSLIAILTICSIGVIFPIVAQAFTNAIISFGVDFYNVWSFPFVIALLVSFIGYSFSTKFGLKKFVVLITGLIIIGFVFGTVGFPTGNVFVNIGFPILVFSLPFSAYRMITTLIGKNKNFRLFGRKLVHFGIIIILIGVFMSSGARKSSVFMNALPNTILETSELTVKLGNFTVYDGTGRVYASQIGAITHEYTSVRLDIEVMQSGKAYTGVLWSFLYINYGFVSKPLIIATERGDIYIHLEMTQSMQEALTQSFMDNLDVPDDLTITIETVPLVYLVWIGAVLLCIGITFCLKRAKT